MDQKYYIFPFADGGDKAVVQDNTQVDGTVSYDEGWGGDYELEQGVAPLAKDIPRDQSNQLMFDVTENVKQYQEHGYPEHITAADNGGAPFGYDLWARVIGTDGHVYESKIAANTDIPPTANWSQVSDIEGRGGDGLTFAAGQFDVNVDDSTIEIDTDALQVKANGITQTELASNSVGFAQMQNESIGTAELFNSSVNLDKINANVAGDGLSGGGGTALTVNVDDSTIEIVTDTLQVKDGGITGDKLSDTINSSIEVLISTTTLAVPTATIGFDLDDPAYRSYRIEVTECRPTISSPFLGFASTDGGTTDLVSYSEAFTTTGGTGSGNDSAGRINLTAGSNVVTTANSGLFMSLEILGLNDTSSPYLFKWFGSYKRNAAVVWNGINGISVPKSDPWTNIVDYIRFEYDSGNMDAGATFKVYGQFA